MKKNLHFLKKTLTFKGYAPNTIKVYMHYAEVFLTEVGKHPSQVGLKDANDFLLNFSYSSRSQQNQLIGAVKVFLKYITGNSDTHLNKIERPRKQKKIPMILSAELLKNKIGAIDNLKHKCILHIAVTGALRVSEVINLKVEDVDSSLMVLRIKGAKGYKDRVVPITVKALGILRAYYREFKPVGFLFNGASGGAYSAISCNKLVKKYLDPKARFHTLRHSAATIMHEQGLDIADLGKILGHNSIKTTMIYTHLSNSSVNRARETSAI